MLILIWSINNNVAENFECFRACVCVCVCACCVQGHFRLFATLWIIALWASLSILAFSRQEYWIGEPFPSPGGLPTQRSNPGLLNYK